MYNLLVALLATFVYFRVFPVARLLWANRRGPSQVPGYYGWAFSNWLWTRFFYKEDMQMNVQQISLFNDKGRTATRLGIGAYFIHSLWQGESFLMLSDPGAVKEVMSKAAVFAKPVQYYKVLGWYGPNMLAADGDEWRRHRKVSGSAFGEDFNRSMWHYSLRYTDEILERLPPADGQGQHVFEAIQTVETLMMMIIAAAGFGKELAWPGEESDLPAHHSMTFLTAMRGMFNNLILKAALPNFVWKLPSQRIQAINSYFTSFEQHILEMVDERRALGADGAHRGDLFSNLIRASDAEQGAAQLDKTELLSNIHIFLLAGHETTAGTLMATLMLLALHPEWQDRLAEEARAAFAKGEGYEAFGELRLTTAAFMEALRLFPAACQIPKDSERDSSLTVHTIPTKPGEAPVPRTLLPPKGTKVRIDVPAMQYSTLYWGEDAAEFRPSRFVDTADYKWPRDAFAAFSGGARGCIGKQAALVEATAFLARVVAKYRIEPAADRAAEWTLRPGESEMARRERIYKPFNGITLSPTWPLVLGFVPRE